MAVQGKLTLRNYRCFNWDNPAILEFGDGFTAYVGANNSGKSTALRSVYELRNIFQNIVSVFYAQNQFKVNVQPLGVADIAEVANDSDPSRFQIEIEITELLLPLDSTYFIVTKILVEYDIQSQSLFAKSFIVTNSSGSKISFDNSKIRTLQCGVGNNRVQYQDGSVVDFSALQDFVTSLSQS